VRDDARVRALWDLTRGPAGIRGSLWRPLAVFRLLAVTYAAGLAVHRADGYSRPTLAAVLLGAMVLWSLAMAVAQPTAHRTRRRGTLWTLVVLDVGTGAAAVLATRAVETYRAIDNGAPTLPGLWAAGGVFAVALVGGTLGGLAGASVIGAATLAERGEFTASTVGSVVLVVVAGSVVGYLVATADAAGAALRAAVVASSAAAERERLAREVHDGALQALALLARDATRGMPPEQVARLAAEQEAALRSLLLTGSGGRSRDAEPAPDAPPDAGAVRPRRSARAGGAGVADGPGTDLADAVEVALRACLPPSRTSFSRPAGPLLLPAEVTSEIAAAVRAALDNVVRHAGADARVFVLLEDEPDGVRVTVRDDGVGMPATRTEQAAAEGRLGISRSIRGRIADLGGTVVVRSGAGEGTEVELCVRR
jgi:signal transduction histidine kinase